MTTSSPLGSRTLGLLFVMVASCAGPPHPVAVSVAAPAGAVPATDAAQVDVEAQRCRERVEALTAQWSQYLREEQGLERVQAQTVAAHLATESSIRDHATDSSGNDTCVPRAHELLLAREVAEYQRCLPGAAASPHAPGEHEASLAFLQGLPEWTAPPRALPPGPAPAERVTSGDDDGDGDNDVALELHAVDANPFMLYMLVDGTRNFVHATSIPGVTGRMRATRAEVVAALEGQDALKALVSTPPLRGKGKRIDVRFFALEPAAFFRLLADVLGVNIVLGALPATRVSVLLDDVPADGALRELARALGSAVQTRGATWYLTSQPLPRPLAARGARLDVDLDQVTAGQALGLIGALQTLPLSAPCEDTSTFSLHLRNVTPRDLATALQVASSAIVEKTGGSTCALPTLPADADRKHDKLTSRVLSAKRAALLVWQGDMPYQLVLPRGAAMRHILLVGGEEEDDFRAPASIVPSLVREPSRWRLTATLVAPGRKSALLQKDTGEVWVVHDNDDEAESDAGESAQVQPGHVVLQTGLTLGLGREHSAFAHFDLARP